MGLTLLKHFEKSLAVGAAWDTENEWLFKKDVKIHYISLVRADGSSWTASKITIKKDRLALTDPETPCQMFVVIGKPGLPVEGWDFKAGDKLIWEMTNDEGVAIVVYLDIYYEEV